MISSQDLRSQNAWRSKPGFCPEDTCAFLTDVLNSKGKAVVGAWREEMEKKKKKVQTVNKIMVKQTL